LASAPWNTGSNRGPPDGTGFQSLAAVQRVTSCPSTHSNLRMLQTCVSHVRKPVYAPLFVAMNTSFPSESGVW